MSNRKRRVAQPGLEAMELRVVPSVSVPRAHHELVVAAQVGKMHDSAKEAPASQRENNEALKHLQQQVYQIHVRSLEHTASAIPTAAEQAATATSNLFKSLESAL
jgi:hypothetical protein